MQQRLAIIGVALFVPLLLLACGPNEEEKAEARRQGQHCLNLGDHNESLYALV